MHAELDQAAYPKDIKIPDEQMDALLTAVQIVWSSHRGSRKIERIGSAHDGARVEALKAVAGRRIAAGQG